MKIYFTSRYKNKEKILSLTDILEKNKHKVVSSWINEPLLKPYSQNEKQCGLMAKKIEAEIIKSDIFILISDRAGTDMFVELGIAIACNKKIFIVGKYNKRSLMHFYPKIKHINTMDDLLKIIK